MALTIDKVSTWLNAAAAIGASLQASGVLGALSPTASAITLAVLAAVNAVAHALSAPKAATPPKA